MAKRDMDKFPEAFRRSSPPTEKTKSATPRAPIKWPFRPSASDAVARTMARIKEGTGPRYDHSVSPRMTTLMTEADEGQKVIRALKKAMPKLVSEINKMSPRSNRPFDQAGPMGAFSTMLNWANQDMSFKDVIEKRPKLAEESGLTASKWNTLKSTLIDIATKSADIKMEGLKKGGSVVKKKKNKDNKSSVAKTKTSKNTKSAWRVTKRGPMKRG